MLDPVLNLIAEMPDQTLNRPGRRIAQSADRMPLDLLGHIQQHVDFLRLRITCHQTVHHPHHPSRTFTARCALATAFVLIEFRQPPDRFDHIGVVVHHDHRRRAEARALFAQIIEIHNRIAHLCTIGARFVAQSNAVVGGDGFSFVTLDKESAVESLRSGMAEGDQRASVQGSAHWARVHSLGGVTIGDDVELGASSTIDRGTIRDTRIGRGTKIDCQVQVGHNAEVGEDVMMCGNVGVSGSARIGDRVVLGGKVGVSDNIFIGDDVIAGGGTNIYTNVPAGRAVLGSPAVKIETEMAIRRELRRLPRLAETLRELQKTVSKLVDKD